MLEFVVISLFLIALVYAAVSDLTSYEIPNWLCLAIVADFLVGAVFGTLEVSAMAWHLSAGLAVLLVGILLFAGGIVGGGDAKLLAACAVWVGWPGLLQFFLVMAMIGGLLAALILGLRRVEFRASWAGPAWFRRLRSADQGIPYGIAIGLGGIVMFKDLPLVASAVSDVLEPWQAALLLAAI